MKTLLKTALILILLVNTGFAQGNGYTQGYSRGMRAGMYGHRGYNSVPVGRYGYGNVVNHTPHRMWAKGKAPADERMAKPKGMGYYDLTEFSPTAPAHETHAEHVDRVGRWLMLQE